MKILIVGQGGREHALAWIALRSPLVSQVFVIPGNDGMKDVATTINLKADDYEGIIRFAVSEEIDLTIIGNEQPLVDGLADMMIENNILVFGPSKNAAMIEGSKLFAKKIMKKYNIPTASYQMIHSFEEAELYLNKQTFPVVIKIDGLAAGKGVVIAQNYDEAIAAVQSSLSLNQPVLIETFLEGIEFSLIALVHQNQVYAFDLAQDYKRAYDFHKGPNTGGMGCYSPVDLIPLDAVKEAMEKIMRPLAEGLVNEGIPFTGFLYGGLMLTKEGVKVIEFNARFGDPEAEVILPRLKSDLINEIMNLMQNKPVQLEFINQACVGVVLASNGYPGHYEKGLPIEISEHPKRILFHMGTKKEANQFVTNGGRVLINVTLGESIEDARNNCYKTLKTIQSESLFYRNDIGQLKS